MQQDHANPYQSPLSEVESATEIVDIVTYRKKLVPMWIKVFGWLFILFGVVIPFTVVYSAINGAPVNFAMFGLSAHGSITSPMSVFLILLFIALAVSAYGLLFGRAWGLMLCLVLGYVSLAICVTTTVVTLVTSAGINIRLEIIVLIPYLIRLHKMKSEWRVGEQTVS